MQIFRDQRWGTGANQLKRGLHSQEAQQNSECLDLWKYGFTAVRDAA